MFCYVFKTSLVSQRISLVFLHDPVIYINFIQKRIKQLNNLVVITKLERGMSLKVELSLSKKIVLFASMKLMKNTFYFTLKALFVLKTFTFLPLRFSYIGKTT